MVEQYIKFFYSSRHREATAIERIPLDRTDALTKSCNTTGVVSDETLSVSSLLRRHRGGEKRSGDGSGSLVKEPGSAMENISS
jgi:hypothetical protein